MFVLALIVAAWIGWYLRSIGRPLGLTARIPGWVYAAAIGVLAVFAVVRNLPAVDGLRG